MDSRNYEFLSLLAYAHLKSGGAAAASDLLAALTVVEPRNAWAQRTLAYARLEAGQHEACLEQVDRCERLGAADASGDKALRLIRSRALWALGRRDEAKRAVADLTLRGLSVSAVQVPSLEKGAAG